jgi:hypothetical protein
LANYFALYSGTSKNRTPFARSKALFPGETLIWTPAQIRLERQPVSLAACLALALPCRRRLGKIAQSTLKARIDEPLPYDRP